MKKKYVKKLIALAVASLMTLGVVACGSEETPAASSETSAASSEAASSASEEAPAESNEVTSITLYPANASLTSGVVGGYMGEYLASRGLEVEVWAYSDDKTNAILASGDLPDVMYVTAEQLETMIDGGMVLALDEYLDDMPHVVEQEELLTPAFNYIRKFRSNDTGSVYCMPVCVGASAAGGQTDRNRVSVNWEIYKEAGYPEINSFDDLIDVMKVMMETRPEDETGKIWGVQMNAGSDATYFGNIILWYRWQGYSEENLPYLLETDMVNGTYTSILEEDSLYYAGLKWYNKAYREGVFDPDSINLDRSTQSKKTKAVSSGTNPGWHDDYFEVYIPGQTIYYNPTSTYGSSNSYIVVNANTENLEGCLEFLDMLSDSFAQIYASMGPEGDRWYTTEDGHLYLTEKAHEWHKKADGSLYVYDKTGEEEYLWNTGYVLNTGVPTGYLGYDEAPIVNRHTDWAEEMQYTTNTANYSDWKEYTGYDTWQELLTDKGAWVSSGPLDNVINFASTPDDMMQLTVDAIKDVVVNASWQMVYAESDEEFNKIWDQMVADCEGLEAQDVIDWRLADLENAMAVRDSLK